ncbi:MAG TPA: glutamate--tRNA ligase [Vicinamibacterales bacterium]|nr:glutamate--tRNA ligase [Vicinamibacterales bacterium]
MRVRFAPSPTGHLHVGNARTALFNWLLARHAGGAFILRIEDTDAERSTAESERAILDDLRWLGLTWDEGPDIGGPHAPYRQSERLAIYQAHASRLLDSGRAYYCFCSASQLEADRQAAIAEGRPPRYRGTCRALDPAESRRRVEAGEPAAVRFAVPPGRDVSFDDVVRGRVAFQADVIGDPVLLRSDGRPAYNFAVVVDDATMEVTHVVRGEDHVSNTPRQILIYEALGYTPPQFAHLSLVLGPDHAPLSKRHGATSVAEFRARGYLPEALFNYLALIGWSPGHDEELLPPEELARRFRLEDVGHSAGVFDENKLAWVNRHYLKQAAPERVARLVLEYLRSAGWANSTDQRAHDYLASLVPIVSTSVDRLDQAPERLSFLFEYDARKSLARDDVRAEFEDPGARGVAGHLASVLSDAPRLTDRDLFRAQVQRLRERTGLKGRALLHPVRVALMGEPQGPELDLAIPAIDRGAELPPGSGIRSITGCRERAAAFARALEDAFS